MSAIPELGSLLATPLAQAMGWALLQFVWQGALVGMVAALALTLLRNSDADVRYVVATIAMSLMLTLPVVSVVQELNAPDRASGVRTSPPASASVELVAPTVAALETSLTRTESPTLISKANALVSPVQPDRLASWLLMGWTIGVVLLTARLVSGWLWIQRLRTHGTPAAAPLREIAERLARRLHLGRAVRIVESAAVEVPTVLGWLKPMVLVPTSALAGLSPAQLEAVLAHELAHVRRHDYAVNVLQTIVETLLFYHPAVWWVSRQIRIERE